MTENMTVTVKKWRYAGLIGYFPQNEQTGRQRGVRLASTSERSVDFAHIRTQQ